MKRSQRIVLSSICLSTALATSTFAQSGAEAKPADSPTANPGTATSAPPAAPAAPRAGALQPPDGKWLKDATGREYFVSKVPKPKHFKREGDSHIEIGGTFSFDIVGEDADFFFAKVYRPVSTAPRKSRIPTAAELENKAKEYEFTLAESDRIVLEPIGDGLPQTGHWRNGFDLADLNGDGHLDFVHSGARGQMNSRPNLFLGDGKGGFRPWREATFPPFKYEYGDIVAADFNGDGSADLAIGVHLRGVLVLYGDGKGRFTQAPNGPSYEAGDIRLEQLTRFSSRKLARLDWNSDGRPEFLAIAEGPSGIYFSEKGYSGRMQESYGIGLFRLDESGKWGRIEGKTDPNLYGESAAIADFNGDGRIDLAASSNTAGVNELVHLQQPDGTWAAAPPLPLRARSWPRAIASGDFNSDGRVDLAVGVLTIDLGVHRAGIDLLFSQADGSWKRQTLYSEGGGKGLQAFSSGDLDGDGHVDLIGGTRDGRVFLFLGDGHGGFTRESSDELSAVQACTVWDIELADLNEDRRQDLVVAFAGEECPGRGHIGAWLWTPTPQ